MKAAHTPGQVCDECEGFCPSAPDRKPIPTELGAHDKRRLRMSTAQHRPATIEVWHFVGVQGCGKSTYAEYFSSELQLSGLRAIEIDESELKQFDGKVDCVLEEYGHADVVLVSHQDVIEGQTPIYWMKDDRLVGFPARRDATALQAQARHDAAAFIASRGRQGGAQ